MKEILNTIKRTPYQSFSAFLVLFFSLFLSMILFTSLTFLNGVLGYLETRPQVTAYFLSSTPEKDIFKVRDELKQSGKTTAINYTNQKQAYETYKEFNKDNPLLLEMVSSDVLPPSLEIFAKKPEFLPQIAEFLKKQGGIDEVQFQQDLVDKLLNITNTSRKISIIFISFLILMTITVVTTTILFKIALKKDEIELLRLIGATNRYIRQPFVNEALFLGITASITSFTIIMTIILYFNPFLSSYLKDITALSILVFGFELKVWPINPIFFIIMFTTSTLFGSLISYISSYLATRKYLKV